SSKKYQGDPHAPPWPFRIIVAGASNSDFRENATHIVLCSGGGSTRKLADIISPYTDADPHKASKVLDGYLRQKEFV
ncbi:13081_t:CDS:2, partial [Funneliformis geosporum]